MNRRKLMATSGIATALLGIVFYQAGCSVVGIRLSEEQPHQVLMQDGKYEVRQYESAIIARTEVDGDYDDVGRKGFRRLGGFIFGDNVEDESIAMTAPVEMVPRDESADDASGWTMTFVMPAEYTMDSLPVPSDPNVIVEESPRRLVAVYRFSGLLSDADLVAHGPKLAEWVESNGYQAVSGMRLAGYDPPWTIPFLRRNEVHVDVEAVSDAG